MEKLRFSMRIPADTLAPERLGQPAPTVQSFGLEQHLLNLAPLAVIATAQLAHPTSQECFPPDGLGALLSPPAEEIT